MTQHDRIVVGVDGSECARDALRLALREAGWRQAALRAVAVIPSPPYWAAGLTSVPIPTTEDIDLDQARAQIQHTVDRIVGELGEQVAAVEVTTVALVGQPAQALVEAAADADLLVVGHRGRGSLARAVLGSVGLQCVQHAPCPVLVVRPTNATTDSVS